MLKLETYSYFECSNWRALFWMLFCLCSQISMSSPLLSPSQPPSDLELRLAKSPCQYESYKIFWNVFVHIFNHWNVMAIKFECSYDVDINMYILCCSNRICACPSGRPYLQVTPPSCLCFAGVLINFRSGKFQALDMSFFSKGHAGFFREFWHDLC